MSSSVSTKNNELKELEYGLIVGTILFTIIRVFNTEFQIILDAQSGNIRPQPNLQIYAILLCIISVCSLYLPHRQFHYSRNISDYGILLSLTLLECIFLSQLVVLGSLFESVVTLLWLTMCCSILVIISYFQQNTIMNYRNNTYILISSVLLFLSITDLIKPTSALFLPTLLILLLFPELTNFLSNLLPKSFSPGELILISKLLSILFVNLILQVTAIASHCLGLSSKLESFFIVATPIFLESHVTLAAELIACGVFLLGIIWKPWLKQCYTHYLQSIDPDAKRTPITSVLAQKATMRANIALVLIVIFVLEPLIWLFVGAEPFQWVFQYLMGTPALHKLFPQLPNGIRLLFVVEFALVLLLSIPLAPNGKQSSSPAPTSKASKRSTTFPNIVIRKYYHILVVILFTPAIILEPEFMCLAFVIGFSVFILMEYIRFVRLEPSGHLLHQFMSTYIDSRDSGLIILTHIYLLLGCALPVWFHYWIYTEQLQELQSNTNPSLPAVHTLFFYLPALSGLITLGIGDSAASIIGTYAGKHRWFNSKKTIEGTVGMSIAMMAFVFVLKSTMNFLLQHFASIPVNTTADIPWAPLFVSILFSCLFEAFTVQIDNLFLPLFLYLWMLLMH